MMDEPVKRKRVTPQTIYMRELRSLKHTNLTPVAMAKQFNDLPRAIQESYELRAKKENAVLLQTKGHTWQKDTMGNMVTDNADQLKAEHAWQEKSMQHICSMVRFADSLRRSWIFGQVVGVEYLDQHSASYSFIISELTLVKWSFAKGVIDKLTIHPRCTDIPMGQVYEFRDSVQEHMGMQPNHNYDDDDFKGMCNKIIKFCDRKGKEAPIFMDMDNLKAARHGLYHLFGEASLACPWVAHPTEFHDLYLYSQEYLQAILSLSTFQSDITTSDILKGSRMSKAHFFRLPLWQGSSLACDWHLDVGQELKCTQSTTLTHVYSFTLSLGEYFSEINLLDEAFMPLMFRQYIVIQEQRDEVSRQNREEEQQAWLKENWSDDESGEGDTRNLAQESLEREFIGLELGWDRPGTSSNAPGTSQPVNAPRTGLGRAKSKASQPSATAGKRRLPNPYV